MNTYSHAIWIYYLFRQKLKKMQLLAISIGSVFPDLMYSLPLAYTALSSKHKHPGFAWRFFKIPFTGWQGYSPTEVREVQDILAQLFLPPQVKFTRLIFHSYVIWAIVFVITLILKRRGRDLGWLLAFLWGWLSHIGIDMLTHVDDATPYFYPVWNRVIHGVVSYWNPEYFGTYFATANYLIILVMLFMILKERWGR